mmetsp:Transcript_4019/g.6114  ORF Transcript_4019/g.6114 Transcript_4019/m.6114 type:complete len:143 (+) Transcript_4019:100-528(+)
MSSASGRIGNHQAVFVRQANILRKNLYEWDQMLHSSTGEDWPSMLGRLNAAMNQTNNLDQSIDDMMNHFVYEPRQSPTNPQDIPMFLSVRLVDDGNTMDIESKVKEDRSAETDVGNPSEVLTQYEEKSADLANEFEESMVRY